MKTYITLLCFLYFLYCNQEALTAATYYSLVGQSNPNNTANWKTNADGSGSSPVAFTNAADIFIVQAAHNYTTSAAWNVSGTVQVSGNLTIQTANSIKVLTIQNGGIVTATAAITITAAGSGGQFNIDNNGRYINNHTSGMASTIFNGTENFNANSYFEYKNITSAFTSNITYGNFIYDCNLSRTFPTTISFLGNVEIKQGTIDFVSARSIGGNYIQSGGNVTLYNSTISGNFTLTGGTARITTETNVSRQLAVGGDVILNGGTFYLNDGPQNVTGFASSLQVSGNFVIDGAVFSFPTLSTTAVAGRVFIGKDCKFLSGSISGFLSTSTLTAGFYFNGSSGSTQQLINKFAFTSGNASNAFYYKSPSGPTTIHEEYSGSVLQNTVNGLFGTPASGYLRWDTSGTTIKNFTINNSANINLRNNRVINDTLYRTHGSITGVGTILYASGKTLHYNGNIAMNTEDKEFPSSSGPTNLIINNPASVSLHTTRTLGNSGMLAFLQGKLISGSCNATTSGTAIILSDNGTAVGYDTSKFVQGICIKTGNDAFTFPIGNSTFFAPVSISAPALVTDQFAACYIYASPDSLYERDSIESSLHHVSNTEYWHINRTVGSSPVSVTLSWDSRSGGITNIPALRVSRWNGIRWTDGGNTSFTGSNATGTLSSSPFSSFSPFTIATSVPNNPLPISLLYYQVRTSMDAIIHQWATATEIQNAYFNIEQSKDAIHWNTIHEEAGAGNSSEVVTYMYKEYSSLHTPCYYRLKQTDFDGTYTYSTIQFINGLTTTPSAYVGPNPFQDYIEIASISDLKQVTVYNSQAAVVYQANALKNFTIQIPTVGWSPGVYIVRIETADNTIMHRLLH